MTVCFTGHREIDAHTRTVLIKTLKREIENLIDRGADCFRTGGALGFDTLAALIVLSLKRQHPHIRLELILPCPTQADLWSREDREAYQRILSRADSVSYVSPFYYNGVLLRRNDRLVEGADVCVAYLTTSHGGTAYTYVRALRSGLEVINTADLLPQKYQG
jgi:uncharacterized phage-like protein YoqJ